MMALSLLVSCDTGSGNSHTSADGDTIAMKYTTNLTMVDYGDYIKADFRNPWDTTKMLQSFYLVPKDKEVPSGLPKGSVVRTPLERSIVYTSVHTNLIDELGATDAITGVCEPQYIINPNIKQLIADGRIADCGSSMAPNIEKILQLKPQAILLSAFENSNDHNKVGQTGIPIIDCTDYMETSPLARAEWMRFFGRLYGKGVQADSLFNETEKAYLTTKALAASVDTRPKVMSEKIYGQSWDVPGAYSTAGVMIEDAGGINIFDNYKNSGSIKLAPEEVLYRAKDADIWLIKYSQEHPLTLGQLASDNEIYTKFNPYKNGRVYGCDTQHSSYFEDAAFHPHWILAEYVNLFHPEIETQEYDHHYYSKVAE